MAALYLVCFDDGRSEYVSSADTKSLKRSDVRTAYVKARKKAEAKHAKMWPHLKFNAVEVRCVG